MSHIHYTEIKKGQRLVVQGLEPLKRMVDGGQKLVPPPLKNGETVTVKEFTVDSVTVIGADGTTEVTFAHHTGAMKLRELQLADRAPQVQQQQQQSQDNSRKKYADQSQATE